MALAPIESCLVDSDQIRARVATRTRQLATRRKMTLTALAQEAGISRSHLYTVLDGERSATTDLLTKLASALGVDPVELMRPLRSKTRAR